MGGSRASAPLRFLSLLFLAAGPSLVSSTQSPPRSTDPKFITYPGDIHFALIINPASNNPELNNNEPTACEQVNADGVYNGMAAIWAAHQVNLKKGHPNQLKIGVYMYDGCRNADVTQRQNVRVLAHLNDVQTKPCRDPRGAPLFGMRVSSSRVSHSSHLLMSLSSHYQALSSPEKLRSRRSTCTSRSRCR